MTTETAPLQAVHVDAVVGRDLQARLERPYRTKFWGRRHLVKPRLLNRTFGDGKKLLGLQPLNTRPQYYVVRIDSTWAINNWDDGETVMEHLEELLDAAEEQFGKAWYDDDPPHRKNGRPWPALNDDVGTCWFEVKWPIAPNAEVSREPARSGGESA